LYGISSNSRIRCKLNAIPSGTCADANDDRRGLAQNGSIGTNISNFSYSTPPTATQMRDRVRAVVHLIVCSPDFTIQK